MAVIAMAGMIGAGKTTLTTALAKRLGSTPFYESVSDNPVLPLFYDDPDKYAFLLQIYFLNKRFETIKQAFKDKNNVLDRTIYEDSLFFHTNAELGRATSTEVNVYDELLANMMEELDGLPKKSPNLLVYIHVDYDTMMARINKRGRAYEQPENDNTLPAYYKTLLSKYDQWYDSYDKSDKLMIDGCKLDFVQSAEDMEIVLSMVDQALEK